jgi:hypothetical protein
MTLLSAIQIQALAAGIQRPLLKGCGLPASFRSSIKADGGGEEGNGAMTRSDSLSIAEPLKALSQGGINLEKSRFLQTSQMLSFDLSYREESIQQLSLRGSYDFHSQSLTADLSFVSALAIKDPETGEERQQLFRFNFHMEANHSLSCTSGWGIQKEDILQFARKLVTKIAKLYSEGKEIDGLALDDEDLKELGTVKDGRLLESIMAMVQMLKMASRLQKREGEHVWVDLDRQKALITNQEEHEQQSLECSLTVEKVVAESNAEPEPGADAQEPQTEQV